MSEKGYKYNKTRAIDFMNMRKRVGSLILLILCDFDRSLSLMVTQVGMNVIESRRESLVADLTMRSS